VNPHLCRIVLRPRGPLEVFDLALALLRTHPGPFLALIGWAVVPATLLLSLLCWTTDGSLLLAFAPCLLAPVIHAPATVLAGRILFSEDATLKEALSELGGRLVPLALAWGQIAVTTLGVLLTCGLLILLSPAVAWVTETALLERIGAARGLRRSVRLASHAAMHALAAAVGWVAITIWGGIVGEASGQGIVSFVLQLGTPFGALTEGQATPWLLAGMLVVQPIYAVWRLLLYIDARTRAEGWDLQVGLRAAGLHAERA
jgi:hypothetical protein